MRLANTTIGQHSEGGRPINDNEGSMRIRNSEGGEQVVGCQWRTQGVDQQGDGVGVAGQ